MKISNKEKNLLLYVLAILLVFASYKFVFEKYTAETDALKLSNGTLETTLSRLEELKANEEQYEKDMKKFEEENEIIMSKFDATGNFEDQIMTVKALEDKEDVFSTQLGTTLATVVEIPYPEITGVDANLVTQEEQVLTFVDTEGVEVQYSNPVGVFLMNQQVSMTANTSYKGMKEFVNYFVNHEDVMSVESIAMSYNDQTGELEGNFVVNVFSMRGNGAEYKPVEVEGVKTGVSNLFGTYQAPVATE